MKLYEFSKIDEKINFAHEGRILSNKINEKFKNALSVIYRKIIKQMYVYNYVNDNDYRPTEYDKDKAREYVAYEIFRTLPNILKKSVEEIGISYINEIYFFDFKKNLTGGDWNRRSKTIRINIKFINELIDMVKNEFIDHFLDSGYELAYDMRYLNSFIERILNQIERVLVHELVHAKQDHKNVNTEYTYSSYAEKKKKFYELMSKEVWDDRTYRAYRSSPEEIGAFATEQVYTIMNDMCLGELTKESYPEDILGYIRVIKETLGPGGFMSYTDHHYPSTMPTDPVDKKSI